MAISNMTLTTTEIKDAVKSLTLTTTEFRKLPLDEAESIFNELISAFVEGEDRKWWWEAFKVKPVFTLTNQTRAFELLDTVVPDAEESL